MCETCGHHVVHHQMWVGACQASGCSCRSYRHKSEEAGVGTENMLCPLGCGWIISPLTDTTGVPTTPQDGIDSLTTQHHLMAEHLREDHDGRIGGR